MEDIIKLLREEYLSKEQKTWVVAFSGGKDSTLLLDLTLRMLLTLPASQRRRELYVIANDTLVESPLVIDHLEKMLKVIRVFCEKKKLPVQVVKTTPDYGMSFWVNLIGKGYPPPNRMFRWCTEKLKIQPTTSFIRKQAFRSGSVLLLLGTRTAESAIRAASIKRHEISHYYGTHSSVPRCMTFKPIRDLTDDDVWEYLGTASPPWGGTYAELIQLYRDANGGECPLVVDTEQLNQPSCGERSPRFGCWTCTLVVKDRSLDGLIRSGHDSLQAYSEFRNWLIEFAQDMRNRLPYGRKGDVRYSKNGRILPGPFTLQARKKILHNLRVLESKVEKRLISDEELERIRSIWEKDRSLYEFIGQESEDILRQRMMEAS